MSFPTNMQGGSQPAPTTVVFVQEDEDKWYRPSYMRQGVRVCGQVLTSETIIGIAFAGKILAVSGIMTMRFASNYRRGAFKDVGSSPVKVIGAIIVALGVFCMVACLFLMCYAKKQHVNLSGMGSGRTTCVYNSNFSPSAQQLTAHPGQTGGGYPSPSMNISGSYPNVPSYPPSSYPDAPSYPPSSYPAAPSYPPSSYPAAPSYPQGPPGNVSDCPLLWQQESWTCLPQGNHRPMND